MRLPLEAHAQQMTQQHDPASLASEALRLPDLVPVVAGLGDDDAALVVLLSSTSLTVTVASAPALVDGSVKPP